MKKFIKLMLCAFCFCLLQRIDAGSICGDVIPMTVGETFVSDGEVIATERIELYVGEVLTGAGYFEAPIIEISTKRFEFTGTINCSQKCIINVEQPFDQAIFKREGAGEFIINIVPLKKMDVQKHIPCRDRQDFFALKPIERNNAWQPENLSTKQQVAPEMPSIQKIEQLPVEERVIESGLSFQKVVAFMRSNPLPAILIIGYFCYNAYEMWGKSLKS